MESEFITIGISTYSETFFITEDGGKLCIVLPKANVSVDVATMDEEDDAEYEVATIMFSFCLGLEVQNEEVAGEDEDSGVCHCRTRVVDADGNLWEAKSLFTTDTLLEKVEDWGRGRFAYPFEDIEKEWKQAFETRLLLTNIRGLYDDRLCRPIVLGNKTYEVPFKYQYPVFDIAYLEDAWEYKQRPEIMTPEDWRLDFSKLLVRVSNFRTREANELPPFVCEMSCETLMFYAQTEGLPVPLVFKKMGTVEQRQPLVQYVPK